MKPRRITYLTSAASPSGFPADPMPEIAFAGRSNVGKSSLINALTGTAKIAKTSRTPGKTRTINFFILNEALRLVDLPGYGYAKVPRPVKASWKRLVEGYFEGRVFLKVVVLVVDSRRGLQEEENRLIEYLLARGYPVEVAVTKADKLRANERRELVRSLQQSWDRPGLHFSLVSSLKGSGIVEFWRRLEEWL